MQLLKPDGVADIALLFEITRQSAWIHHQNLELLIFEEVT